MRATLDCLDCGKPKDGNAHSRCRACQVLKTQAWKRANPEKAKESERRCSQRRRENGKIWLYSISKKYGLTPDQYYGLVQRSEGRCAACGDARPDLHIDHDHATGKVRGLLCPNCNKALGLLRDSPDVIEGLLRYLGKEEV